MKTCLLISSVALSLLLAACSSKQKEEAPATVMQETNNVEESTPTYTPQLADEPETEPVIEKKEIKKKSTKKKPSKTKK